MSLQMATLLFRSWPLLGVELLHASDVTHTYPAHLHEQDSIGIVLQGEERILCGDRTYIARAGEAFVIAAEDVHSGESRDSEYLLMKVAAARPLPTGIIDDRSAARIVGDLLVKLDRGVAGESAVACILDIVTPRSAREPDEPAVIREAREYVRSHSVAGVSVLELTAIAKLSRSHFLRRFHSAAGVPPHQYQTQVRIAHARRLLRKQAPISQAALQAGFVDQSHLSRHFKRIVGMTPADYVAQSTFVQDGFRARR
jgi:AraC-like DNA-binding protein